MLDHETRMWNQHSRILWLKNGDGNTKFFHRQAFHRRASHRYQKNLIIGINDQQGVWKEEPNAIAEVLTKFYHEIFTTSNLILHQGVLDQIPQVISNEMNQELMCKFEKWEVAQALKQMAPLKASGPDGMPPLFFQHF